MSWRDDPDLVRQDGSGGEVAVAVDDRWARVFALVDQVMAGQSGVMVMAAKGAVTMARRRAAEDPEGTRQTVIQALRVVAAALEIEPGELYE